MMRSVFVLLLVSALLFSNIGGINFFFGWKTPVVEAAYSAKHLRTVEFALGGGAGTAADQTGTENNGVAQLSDANLYAGNAWNATKGTAGTKLVQVPGSGIKVLSAYLDVSATLVSAVDVTDLEIDLDVTPGSAAGQDISVSQVSRNAVGLLYMNTSGDSPLLTAKANVTALFQTQTDSDWNTGLNVVGLLSVTGPTWHLATMKLVITYEENYSLVPHDELKTVRFPLRSTTAGDSGTKSADCAIGATCSFTYTIDIPDLMNTADIVDAWFELSYVGAGVDSITPSINGGAAGTAHNSLEALADRAERYIIYRPAIGGADLATTSNQRLDVATAVAAIGGLGGEVVVTYKHSTGAPIQTETVQYWMGQQGALPGTASSSFSQFATISNGSIDPCNIWFRVHDSITNAPIVHVAGKIGASATTTVSYTTTSANARAGEMRIIHDMGAATTSWSGSATTLSIDVRHQANTYDGSPGVEAFITFHWAGSLGGTVTQTGKFFAGTSGAVPALANSDNTFPFTVILPETVTKTLRSSYLATSVIHSDVTTIIPGTVQISLSGSAPIIISEGTEDTESFRAIYVTQATSTNFTPGATIPWNSRAFQTIVRGNQTEEYSASAEMVVTYDAAQTLKVPILTQDYYRFYVDNNALLPTDPWPAGAVNLSENSSIGAGDLPPDQGERLRLRMSYTVATTTLVASSNNFALQYGAPTSTCANLGNTWANVGAIGGGTLWRGYNTGVAEETNLGSNPPLGGELLLSLSDRAATFEESNNSAMNPFAVFIGEDVEYDWVVEDNLAATNTPYCFRMAYSNGTPLPFYSDYPVVKTAGYTPKTRNWHWYSDENNETPTTQLAGENVAPVNIKNGDISKLRITVADTRGHSGVNQKFRLQYSTYSDFSQQVAYVDAMPTCGTLWCYGNGVDQDDDAITSLLLTDSAVKGRHNEEPVTASTIDPIASTAYEFEYTIKHAGAYANTTYFFRLYDVNNNIPVPLDTGASYPSLSTGDTTLTFEVAGTSTAKTIEGLTTTFATTPTTVPFGDLAVGVSAIGAHTLTVTTNAIGGYQIFVSETQNFLSAGGAEIPGVNASNTAPVAWGTACTGSMSGCFGYHAGDDSLFGGSARFLSDDTWAEFEIPAREVMFAPGPVASDTANMLFRTERHLLLPAGQYETQVRYIVVPIF